MGFRQPWVARRRQVVSAFQVGVSSAKKRSYSVGERGLPGVEAEFESWAGVVDGGRSTTARQEQTDGWMELQNPLQDRPSLASGAPCKLGTGDVCRVVMPGAETKVSPGVDRGGHLTQPP